MSPATELPVVRLTLGDLRRSGAVGTTVAAVRVRSRLAMPTQCVLTLDASTDGTGVQAPGVDPGLGDGLRVDVLGQDEPLFTGEVTAVEHLFGADGSRYVRVRAYDLLHRLRQRQSVRVHEHVTLADLARDLSSGTGLATDGPSAPRWERVYQTGESDLQLLRDTAGRCGRYPVVDGDRLRLVDLEGWGEVLDLTLGVNLHRAALETAAEPGFARVHAYRWDAARADDGSVTSDAGGDAEGGGERVVAGEAVSDDAALSALAAAEAAVLRAGATVAALVAEGDTRLRAGRRVRLRGTSPAAPQPMVVTDATHVLDRDGYSVDLSTRPPPVPQRPESATVTLAEVSAVDDPAGAGRVRLRLPSYGAVETGWAPVVVAGAAEGQGAVLLPDVGDRVVVLLPQGNPEQALVLGGLFGATAPGDAGVEGGRVTRWTVGNRTGQRLVLDARAQRLTLQGHNGSLVELGADLLRIRATTDLVIEAPGRALTVRARSVDFQEAR